MATDSLLYTEVEADVLQEFVNPPAQVALDGLAKFRWNSNYLHIKVVDPANTIKIEQKVTPEMFNVYDVDTEESGEIVTGVDCNSLLEFLQHASGEELVEFEASYDKLHIQFGHMSGSFSKINPDTISEPGMNDHSHSVEATVSKQIFTESENISSSLGPKIEFSIKEEQFDVRCTGYDNEIELNYDVVTDKDELDADSANVYINDLSDGVSPTFSYDIYQYIPNFVPEGYFTVEIDDTAPMVISCNRAENRIPTRIALAQRIPST